jgi:hypothetical protein
MKMRFLLIAIVVMFSLLVNGFAQSAKCDGFDRTIKYKILFEDASTRKSEIFLEVYVASERFTVDSMMKLIRRLRTEYCNLDSISVRFYDTQKVDRMPDPPPQPLIDWHSKTPFKGFYEYNRKANTGELTFREGRSDELVDVEIIFRSGGYCLTEKRAKPIE